MKKWNELSMADRAKYIKLGVQNGITDIKSISDAYNVYADGGNKSNSNRERIASIIASNPMFAGVDIDTALANYEDTVRERNAMMLPEVEIVGHKTKRTSAPSDLKIPTKENMFIEQMMPDALSWQFERDRQLADTSPEVLKTRRKLSEADAITNAQTFTGANVMRDIVTPISNLYMPSQWIGAAFDAVQGERGFWEGLGRGNSGFVPDKFAEEHPYWSMGANILGDAGSYYFLSKINPSNLNRFTTTKKFNDTNKVYHADMGNNRGFTTHGAYIKNGKLYPGKTNIEGQNNYIWWNEGKPYYTNINGKPVRRMIISDKDNISDLLRVREQDFEIGQWNPNSKKSFVTKKEMVSSNPIDKNNLDIYRRLFNSDIWFRTNTAIK